MYVLKIDVGSTDIFFDGDIVSKRRQYLISIIGSTNVLIQYSAKPAKVDNVGRQKTIVAKAEIAMSSPDAFSVIVKTEDGSFSSITKFTANNIDSNNKQDRYREGEDEN